MKVKISDINDLDYGKEFIVLSLHITSSGKYIRIIFDEDMSTPSYSNIEHFSIIDSSIPSSWIIVKNNNNQENLDFLPESWQDKYYKYSFWESFFDGDLEACRNFDIEKERIYSYYV